MNEQPTLSRLPIGAALEIVLLGDGAIPDQLGTKRLPSTALEGDIDRIGPLPIEPRRWLWLGLEVGGAARAVDFDASNIDGVHAVDVDGKWAAFTCEGAAARRTLSSVVDLDRVLEPRGCATLKLFDCPAVLLSGGGDRYLVCVQSSYAPYFERAFDAVGAAVMVPVSPVGDSNGNPRIGDNGDPAARESSDGAPER
jgi:hypothetical protein